MKRSSESIVRSGPTSLSSPIERIRDTVRLHIPLLHTGGNNSVWIIRQTPDTIPIYEGKYVRIDAQVMRDKISHLDWTICWYTLFFQEAGHTGFTSIPVVFRGRYGEIRDQVGAISSDLHPIRNIRIEIDVDWDVFVSEYLDDVSTLISIFMNGSFDEPDYHRMCEIIQEIQNTDSEDREGVELEGSGRIATIWKSGEKSHIGFQSNGVYGPRAILSDVELLLGYLEVIQVPHVITNVKFENPEDISRKHLARELLDERGESLKQTIKERSEDVLYFLIWKYPTQMNYCEELECPDQWRWHIRDGDERVAFCLNIFIKFAEDDELPEDPNILLRMFRCLEDFQVIDRKLPIDVLNCLWSAYYVGERMMWCERMAADFMSTPDIYYNPLDELDGPCPFSEDWHGFWEMIRCFGTDPWYKKTLERYRHLREKKRNLLKKVTSLMREHHPDFHTWLSEEELIRFWENIILFKKFEGE